MLTTLILSIVGLGQFNCTLVDLKPQPTLECVQVVEEIKEVEKVKTLTPRPINRLQSAEA